MGAPALGPSGAGGHTYEAVFNRKAAGFTLHTFSGPGLAALTTQFIDASGAVIHAFNQTRGQPYKPSGGSGGLDLCKNLGCGGYARSQPCQCNDQCTSHHDCCRDYSQVCGHRPDAAAQELA